MRSTLLALVLLLTVGATPPPAVSVGGAFVKAESLDRSTVGAMPHVTISATEHDGTTSQYSGVRLADIVHGAGAPVGADVRGAPARTYVSVEGSDGYIAIYSLAELQTSDERCAPIFADMRNGAPLGDTGPFRIVSPCDRTQARWVRNVISIELVTVSQLKL